MLELDQIFTTNDIEFARIMNKKIKSRLSHTEIQQVFDTYIEQEIAKAKKCETVEDINMRMNAVYLIKAMRKEIYGY